MRCGLKCPDVYQCMSKADRKGFILAGVYTGGVGTDAFPGVSGNVYKSLLMVCSHREMKLLAAWGLTKTEYAVIRWYNDGEALVLFTG